MKNLLAIILAIGIAVFVWYTQDENQDSQAKTNQPGASQPDKSLDKSRVEKPVNESGESGKQTTPPAKQPITKTPITKQPAEEKPATKPAVTTPTKQPITKTPVKTPDTRQPTDTKKRIDTRPEIRSVIVKLRNGTKVDIGPTLDRIKKGIKHPHRNDGSVFGNYEKRLPRKPRGYYREYVHPTPGIRHAGARRVVMGKRGEIYYTHDHYKSFTRVTVR